MSEMVDLAIKALIRERVQEAKQEMFDEIVAGLKTSPNAKRFPADEYVRLYHDPYK